MTESLKQRLTLRRRELKRPRVPIAREHDPWLHNHALTSRNTLGHESSGHSWTIPLIFSPRLRLVLLSVLLAQRRGKRTRLVATLADREDGCDEISKKRKHSRPTANACVWPGQISLGTAPPQGILNLLVALLNPHP